MSDGGSASSWSPVFRSIATGLGFLEGPVIDGDRLVVVSLDQGHVYAVRDGLVDLVSALGGAPNGAALTIDGDIVIAQNGGHVPGRTRRSMPGGVQVLTPSGHARWLTLDPVFPTDLCIGPDGKVYVTDATRGPGYDDGRLWRCDLETGESTLLCSVPWFPNGVAFGPDDRLYVASSGDGTIYVSDWSPRGITEPSPFCVLADGRPDGLAFDEEGRLLVAAVGEEDEVGAVHVIDAHGAVVDRFEPSPSRFCTNLALATDRRLLVVTDSSTGTVLATTDYPLTGLELYPFRGRPHGELDGTLSRSGGEG